MSQSKLEQALEEFKNAGFDDDEEDKFTDFAILFIFDGENKTKVGPGIVRILKNKSNQRTRVLMRNREGTKVMLNHYILPSIKYEDDVAELMYSTKDFADGEEGKEIKISLKFPEERGSMNDFINEFEKGQKSNEKLLKA